MRNGYIYLTIAILGEIFGTTMLKLSDGFSNLLPALGLIIGMGLAFYFLSLSLKTIPLSLAYAVWSGVGTALTALIGVLLWNDPFGILTGVGLLLIIGGVVILNTSNASGTVQESSK
ncbi:DMT family transporter [Paenibacillus gallinarum]|uniref:Multidrug efflux SMR transporter n=1 Tax=Paenibacillus gallinarum TaxID=2762232 RepID=A0ABR8SX32_9BACL|nr:multidrug efflux SMR transporter [Paenibacillus gallinarum]MBD7968056.1 multidrug efflux SMR transporter [Paenibacillus gallinarum]